MSQAARLGQAIPASPARFVPDLSSIALPALVTARAGSLEGTAAGTYGFFESGIGAAPNAVDVGGQSLSLHAIDTSLLTLPGRTVKFRVEATVATNATAPVQTYTFGLYPVTVGGGANALVYTLGTVVSGSTILFSGIGANTVQWGSSAQFNSPAAVGAGPLPFALGVVLTGAQAASSSVGLHARLILEYA